MRIFSPTTVYTVLTLIDGGERRFIVRDSSGSARLIVVIKDEREAKRLLPFLIEWREREAFTEFIEFFPDNGKLFAVFAYYPDGLPLENILENAENRHRACVLRSLFALMLSQDLPPEILSEVLKPENLFVSRSGKVRLLYDLPCGGAGTLGDAVGRIVGGEESAEYGLVYSKLISKIENDSLREYSEMYAAADIAAAALEAYAPPPVRQRLNAAEALKRVRARKEALLARGATLLALILLLAGYTAVGVLFYNTVIEPRGIDNGIRQIGTVMVDDGT